MWPFPKDKIVKTSINSSKFAQPIPTVYVNPQQLDETTSVFIFNGGLGSTNDGNLYMNNEFYNNHYYVTFEKAGQGNNKNKPSQFKKQWLIELDEVVTWAQQTFPNRKIYLLGESWGSNIALLYYLKNKNKVAGAIFWNMPTKPIDPDKKIKSRKEKCSTAFRQLGAIIFNKPIILKTTNKDFGTISRNPILVRAMNLNTENRQNALLTAAVWRFMGPSKRALFKYGKDDSCNFLYVQSGQDAMADKKMLPKFSKSLDEKHYNFMATGYHILSFEPNESKDLYAIINKFISK